MPVVPSSPAVLARAPAFQRAILSWYGARGRDLSFRGSRDPYAVLVSEIMAQQTQVGRVGPAWSSFIRRFPTFEALAAAPPAEVLRQWRGLGYNRRALNLQRTARAVMERHDGTLPCDVTVLQALPGIGPYTARAVAAIAFGLATGAVDTNVRRVLGRVAAGDPHALTPAQLQRIADALVPRARAADWTHALMDLGATQCRSTAPRCDDCPAAAFCAYALRGLDGRRHDASPRVGRHHDASRRVGVVPFEASERWLRGRIVDRARDADGDGWTPFRERLGLHDAEAVQAMLGVLAAEGLLELHPRDGSVARLPVAADAGAGGGDASVPRLPAAADAGDGGGDRGVARRLEATDAGASGGAQL